MPERDEAYLRERVIRYFQDVKHETSSKYAKYLTGLVISRDDNANMNLRCANVFSSVPHLDAPMMHYMEEFGERKIDGHIIAKTFSTGMGMFTIFLMMENEHAKLPSTSFITTLEEGTQEFVTKMIGLIPESQEVFFFMSVSLRLCTQCHQKKMQYYKCSACRCEGGFHVRYCSKACQQAHWPIHRKSCLSLKPLTFRSF